MWKCNLRIYMVNFKVKDIKDLMFKVGISRSAINKLYHERDLQTIKMETLTKLCDFFGCSSSDLLEYFPNKPENNDNGK